MALNGCYSCLKVFLSESSNSEYSKNSSPVSGVHYQLHLVASGTRCSCGVPLASLRWTPLPSSESKFYTQILGYFSCGKKNIAMAYCDDLVKKCLKSADNVGSEDRLLPWHLYHPWHRLPGDFSHLRHSFLGSSRTWHRPSKLDMFRIRPLNIFGIDANLQRWPSWASLAAVELGKSPPGCLARSVGRRPCFFFYFAFSPFPFLLQLFVFAFFSLFSSQFFAFLMIIFFGEVASGVLVYYQVEEVFFKLNAKWCNRI